MNALDSASSAQLRRAARQLGGPAPSFDRAGLVALADGFGQAKVSLIAGDDATPALAIFEQPNVPMTAVSSIFAALSPREREIVALIGDGRTNREIGAELWISIATVKDHVHHVLRKTGLPNRAAVAGHWRSERRA